MRSGANKYCLGFFWDLFRFFMIFALLLGDTGNGIVQGNFLILMLGISGQPALSFLWFRERAAVLAGEPGDGRFLAVCRFPSFCVEVLVLAAFFLGTLPGNGELMLFSNLLFPEGFALSVLFFLCAGDLFIEIFLLFLIQNKGSQEL